jgi:hypothetical protein
MSEGAKFHGVTPAVKGLTTNFKEETRQTSQRVAGIMNVPARKPLIVCRNRNDYQFTNTGWPLRQW